MDEKLKRKLDAILTGSVDGPAFYELVEEYYRNVIWKMDEDISDEELASTSPYYREWELEIKDRPSGIHEALTVLLNKDYDINECGDCTSALMPAVQDVDAKMVKFLLEHGADAARYPSPNGIAPAHEQNWYLDDIDINYFNYCIERNDDAEYKSRILQTLMVLIKDGGLRSYGGMCLLIDEDGHGSLDPPQMKY